MYYGLRNPQIYKLREINSRVVNIIKIEQLCYLVFQFEYKTK